MIVTVGPSGADYTSLSAAEAGEQADLTVLGEPMEFECAAMQDTSGVSFDGWTTSAANYIRVYPAAGAEAQMPYATSGVYRLEGNEFLATLQVPEDYVRIERIQIDNLRDGSGGGRNAGILRNIGVGELRITGCSFRKTNPFVAGNRDNAFINVTGMAAGDTVKVTNCFGVGHAHGITHNSNTGTTLVVDNNSFVNATAHNYSFVLYGATDVLRVRNNLGSGGGTADYYFESTAATPDYRTNASSDTSGPADTVGGATLRSRTFTFAGASDFHIATGDAGAQGAGTDLSADATNPFSTDFDGDTRTAPWDVGADQFVSGGGGTVHEALSCTPGAVAITGQSATLRAHRVLTCSPGAIVLTGQAATLRTARQLVAQAGTVAVNGTQATLRATRQLVAQPGAVTITGVNATLTKNAAGLEALTCTPGTFAIAGQAATLRAHRELVAQPGAVALSGQAATLAVGRALLASPGAVTISGQLATLRAARRLVAQPGQVIIAGQNATLTYSAFVPGTPGQHPLSVEFTAISRSVEFTAITRTVEFTPITRTVEFTDG